MSPFPRRHKPQNRMFGDYGLTLPETPKSGIFRGQSEARKALSNLRFSSPKSTVSIGAQIARVWLPKRPNEQKAELPQEARTHVFP